jgi:hypothetical protein
MNRKPLQEFLGNKKPLSEDKGYAVRAAEAPKNAPVAKPKTPATEVLSHEFC